MYQDYYEQQQDQAREAYYISGVTDGYDNAPIQYVTEEYLSGYKQGLFNILESKIDSVLAIIDTDEPPF